MREPIPGPASELLLLQQGVRGRWPIPDSLRIAALVRLEDYIVNSQDARLVTRAVAILKDIDNLNLADEQFRYAKRLEKRLAALERQLNGVGSDAAGEAGGVGGDGPASPPPAPT